MAGKRYFRAMDKSEEWYETILQHHLSAATKVVSDLIAATTKEEGGCMVSETAEPRKLRFLDGQDRAYRFVYCITRQVALTRDQVVRHRCHNRRCVNPEHLEEGSRADNLRDERERKANGVDLALL